MSTHGSRITDGGYQAPATDAVKITRGRAIRRGEWTVSSTRVTLELVPLQGGRPDFWEIALQTDDKVKRHSSYVPCMVRGRELAERAYALTARELDQGSIPAVVILPPGAPLGW